MGATVVVLGMHRSGTSCVTRMLNHCGLFLGDDVLDSASVSNMNGKWEARRAVEINDALLAASGVAWNEPPKGEVVGTDETSAAMREFLDSLAGARVAGWKDPRTVLTFPLWKPQLGPYRMVACLRHPRSVAESLAKREGWPLERGLELWLAYNQRLLDIVAGETDVVWFDFDLAMSHVEPWLRSACRRLGLEFQPKAVESFNEFNRHHRHVDPPDDPRIRGVYQDLWFRAHQDDVYHAPAPPSDRETRSRSATAALAASTQGIGLSSAHDKLRALEQATEALASQLRYLADAHNTHHTLTQPIARGFDKLRTRWDEIDAWRKRTEETIHLVEKRAAKMSSSVKANSLRLDAYDQRLGEHASQDLRLEKMINKYGDRWSAHEGRLTRAETWMTRQEEQVGGDLARHERRLANCESWIAEYERQVAEYRARMLDCEALLTQCADRVSQCETFVTDLRYGRWRWLWNGVRRRLGRIRNWFRRPPSRSITPPPDRARTTVPPPKTLGADRTPQPSTTAQNLRIDQG